MGAHVAFKKIIWQSHPEFTEEGEMKVDKITGDPVVHRVEIAEGKALPKTVPMHVQKELLEAELVYWDDKVEMPEQQEGAPIMLAPVPRKPYQPIV